MPPLFYSTGQVARQLGITQAAVRVLCDTGVMAFETTSGGQLRIPESEVKRFNRDGLPSIPRPLPAERTPSAKNGLVRHSDSPATVSEVASAADLVAVTRSVLEKRKIDREIEENEDWFVERQCQRAAEEAIERQKSEAKLAEQQRQRWLQQWILYAFNSVPTDAWRQVEIEVRAAVDATLSGVPTSQADAITKRLVDAAVHQAIRPWTRKQEIEQALNSAIDKLPWAVRNGREYVPLKLRASEAAVEALDRLREVASYQEMETVAVQAVQPVIRAYEHHEGCQRLLRRVYLFGATREEQEVAKEAVRKALAVLPIGAPTKGAQNAAENQNSSTNSADESCFERLSPGGSDGKTSLRYEVLSYLSK